MRGYAFVVPPGMLEQPEFVRPWHWLLLWWYRLFARVTKTIKNCPCCTCDEECVDGDYCIDKRAVVDASISWSVPDENDCKCRGGSQSVTGWGGNFCTNFNTSKEKENEIREVYICYYPEYEIFLDAINYDTLGGFWTLEVEIRNVDSPEDDCEIILNIPAPLCGGSASVTKTTGCCSGEVSITGEVTLRKNPCCKNPDTGACVNKKDSDCSGICDEFE